MDCVDQTDEDQCQLVSYPSFQYSQDKVRYSAGLEIGFRKKIIS